MIEFRTGDMFSSDGEAFVNTVNCVGIMGRGVALQFKERYPANFRAYKDACDRSEVVPGKMFVFDTGNMIGPRWLINFPTKRHWRGASRIEDISLGLDDLRRVVEERGIKSIVMPPLGCGLGGLDWTMVKSLIWEKLMPLADVSVCVYEPDASRDIRPVRNTAAYEMKRGGAALALLSRGYLKSALDPVLTLLKVHKLMYFMQVVGEDLSLRYVKAPYGPFAENLKFVLRRTEGHILYGYLDDGQRPYQELHLVPQVCDDAEKFLQNYPETVGRISRVGELTDGYESDAGMELLATTHWVCDREGADTAERACELVHSWSERKRMFTQRQIDAAFARLSAFGLVPSASS